MKKNTAQYSSLFEPIVIISAIFIGMYSEGQVILTLKWLSLSLLWGFALWYLRKPDIFYSIIKDKVFISYLVFVVWATFSSLFLSSTKSISIITLIPFIAGLLSYLIAQSGNNQKDHYFDWLLVGLGLILAFYTCYQKFMLGIDRPTGALGNWNSHATVLAIIILPWILRYSLKPSLNQFQLISISCLSFIFAFAIGLTLSRGVLLIIMASVLSLAFLAWRQRLFYKHSAVFFVALIAGYLITGLFSADSIVSRLQDSSQADSLVALGSGRHLLWLPAWQMYLDRPFFGWGLGTFRFLYMQYKPPLSEESGHFAHNDYLQFLLELGPIGLLIFVSFVFVLSKQLFNLITSSWTNQAEHKIEAFALLSTCAGLLLHTFFTFHLYHLSMQIIFGYYLGRSARNIAEPCNINHSIQRDENPRYQWLYRGFTSLVILLAICFGLAFYFLNNANQEKNKQTKLDYYWKASLFFPALERYNSLSASLISKHLTKIDTKQDSSQQREQMTTLALTEINTAIDKMPFNTRNYLTKISILQSLNKGIPAISEQYEIALKVAPAALSTRYQYAKYLIDNNLQTKALSILWAAWNRLNVERYQTGIAFLTYQLEINNQHGDKKDNLILEQEIQRLTKLKKSKKGGEYVFKKK